MSDVYKYTGKLQVAHGIFVRIAGKKNQTL